MIYQFHTNISQQFVRFLISLQQLPHQYYTLRDMTQCRTAEIYGRFGGNCCLRLRGGIWREQFSSKRRKIYTRKDWGHIEEDGRSTGGNLEFHIYFTTRTVVK
jgi:hypothetical protein